MTKREAKKSYILAFFVILGIILLFAGIDFLAHKLSHEYDVPSYYFRNKIIYGTIIAFIAYLFLKNKKPFMKALGVSAITCVLLQIRYYLEGYPLDFVVLFLFIHFVILLSISWLAFKFIKKI